GVGHAVESVGWLDEGPGTCNHLAGDGGAPSARLEGSGGIGGLVLDPEIGESEPASDAWRLEQRSIALPESHRAFPRAERQEGTVAPHPLPTADLGAGGEAGGGPVGVAHQPRPAAGLADGREAPGAAARPASRTKMGRGS